MTLANYLLGTKIVNGLGGDRDTDFNGLGCMAASIIAELKEEAGNVYIDNPNSPHGWLDYEYVIWGSDHKDIWISVFNCGDCIFVGKPYKLLREYGD